MLTSSHQEWKERFGTQREEFATRNRSINQSEMKETNYSDTASPANANRRKPRPHTSNQINFIYIAPFVQHAAQSASQSKMKVKTRIDDNE